MLWDITSKPPVTYDEAKAVGLHGVHDPQMVLWGRTWPYSGQYIVEAFLLIRQDVEHDRVGVGIWKAELPNGITFSVDIPRWQVDFAPIVLRSDLLPELRALSDLKLYSSASGLQVIGTVGDKFDALEQDADGAKIELPDGTQGWVRLPNLSRKPSEVVNFVGAVVRVFRQDWEGRASCFYVNTIKPQTLINIRYGISRNVSF